MPAETSHHPSGPVALALSLAAIAGFVDAYLFLNVTNVFVANMSGNMVRLGILIGDARWAEVGGLIAALFAFSGGVVVAITHHDRTLRQRAHVRPDGLLVGEACLLVLLPLVLIAFDPAFSTDPGPVQYLIIGLGALAMGIQVSALRRVGDIAVATTYGTGTIVRIGEKIALGLRRADRVSDHRRTTTIVLLVAVLVSYIGGAAIASALGTSHLLMFIPPVVLGASAVANARSVSPAT